MAGAGRVGGLILGHKLALLLAPLVLSGLLTRGLRPRSPLRRHPLGPPEHVHHTVVAWAGWHRQGWLESGRGKFASHSGQQAHSPPNIGHIIL